MLPRYAALLKNMRGVIFSSLDKEGFLRGLEFLRRRFRYRNLGIPPVIRERYGIEVKEGVLVNLVYPLDEVRRAVSSIAAAISVDLGALDAVALASLYVSPLMVLGLRSLEQLRPLIVGTVETGLKLDAKSWKLHMRIADYTVLDFYAWATSAAYRALTAYLREGDEEALSKHLEERRSRIEKDKRRYWRIADKGEAPRRPVIVYVDLLPALAERLRESEGLRKLLIGMGDLLCGLFGILAGVVIPEDEFS